jgi:hypothetical protein
MAAKKKRKKAPKKVVCNETIDAVVQALTSPPVISAAGMLIQMLRTSGKHR